MNEEQAVRERLEAVDIPASRLGVEGLLAAGRRRVRRRRVVAAGSVAVAAAAGVLALLPATHRDTAVPVLPAASFSCTTQATLPAPPGLTDVAVTAVDPSGRHVVGSALAGQDNVPVMWTDGEPTRIPVFTALVGVSDVNASGVAVGVGQDGGNGLELAYRYADGDVTLLAMPDGAWKAGAAPRINAAGDVVVNAYPAGSYDGSGSIVVLWPSGSAQATVLPLPAGAEVHDIADDGTLAGVLPGAGDSTEAWVWDRTGRGRKLETPAGKSTGANAINGGWVTGGVWPDQVAARWDVTSGELVISFGSDEGHSVQAGGLVVAGGTLFRDGSPVPLPGSIVAVSDTGLAVALDGRSWRC